MQKHLSHQVFKRPMPLGELCPNQCSTMKPSFFSDSLGVTEDFLGKLAVPIPNYSLKRKENEKEEQKMIKSQRRRTNKNEVG